MKRAPLSETTPEHLLPTDRSRPYSIRHLLNTRASSVRQFATETMAMASPKQIRVFCSYSQKDRRFLKKLDEHFSVLKRSMNIAFWQDAMISPGTDWSKEIESALKSADIVLLLISSSFFASRYCIEIELEKALVRAELGQTRIVPILLRPCDFRNSPIAHLASLPRDGTPIQSGLRINERRIIEVVDGIRSVISEILVDRQRSPRETPMIPSGLTFLCNRSRQEMELEAAFITSRLKSPSRPFICVVHGDDRERLDGYLLRLRSFTLPRILALPPDDELHHVMPIRWPSGIPLVQLRQFFESQVAANLNCGMTDIKSKLCEFRSHVLAYTEILSEDWLSSGDRILERFLEFWKSLGEFPIGAVLIVILLIKYQSKNQQQEWMFPEQVEQIRKLLTRLEFDPTCPGVVLTELSPIAREDVQQLADMASVREFCRIDRHIAEWSEDLNEIFGSTERIPMQMLDAKLRPVLERYATRM